MDITIRINCDNASFEDDPESQISWILQNLAREIRNGLSSQTLFDINGNRVGELDIQD